MPSWSDSNREFQIIIILQATADAIMNTLKLAKTSSCLLTGLLLVACGGSGGSGNEGAKDSLTDTGGTTEETGNDSRGGSSNGTPGSDTTDHADNNTSNNPGGNDTGVTTVTTGGRQARVLVARGGPVYGAPGATMRSINDFQINAAGQVAFTGEYASGNQKPNGV